MSPANIPKTATPPTVPPAMAPVLESGGGGAADVDAWAEGSPVVEAEEVVWLARVTMPSLRKKPLPSEQQVVALVLTAVLVVPQQ